MEHGEFDLWLLLLQLFTQFLVQKSWCESEQSEGSMTSSLQIHNLVFSDDIRDAILVTNPAPSAGLVSNMARYRPVLSLAASRPTTLWKHTRFSAGPCRMKHDGFIRHDATIMITGRPRPRPASALRLVAPLPPCPHAPGGAPGSTSHSAVD